MYVRDTATLCRSPGLALLPNDVWLNIAGFLPLCPLGIFAAVSKSFLDIFDTLLTQNTSLLFKQNTHKLDVFLTSSNSVLSRFAPRIATLKIPDVLPLVELQCFTCLTNLTQLHLSFHLPTPKKQFAAEWLGWLPKLTTLDLGYNEWVGDEILSTLTNLRVLAVVGSRCIITANGVKDLTNLTSLSLSYNKNFRRPNSTSWLPNFTNLRSLDISGTAAIDDDISGLTQLTKLDTSDNITDSGVIPLIRLKDFYAKNSKVTDESLCYLTNLTSLVPSIEHTDEGLQHLTNLLVLDLRRAGWSISDMSLTRLTNLKELWHGSQEGVTDKTYSYLTNLTKLQLWDNFSITDEGLSCLVNLKSLRIAKSSISDEGMKHLTALTELDISPNYLDHNSVSLLTNLTDLSNSNPDILEEHLKQSLPMFKHADNK